MRSGKHHTSYGAILFLKEMFKKLPSHIEKVRLRGDCGFFGFEMLKFLWKSSIEFFMAVPLQSWEQREVRPIRDWKPKGWWLSGRRSRERFPHEASQAPRHGRSRLQLPGYREQ